MKLKSRRVADQNLPTNTQPIKTKAIAEPVNGGPFVNPEVLAVAVTTDLQSGIQGCD